MTGISRALGSLVENASCSRRNIFKHSQLWTRRTSGLWSTILRGGEDVDLVLNNEGEDREDAAEAAYGHEGGRRDA